MTKVRTLCAFAATGCALLADCSRTQGGGEIQRRGEFDPRWLCKVLMAVASVLCLLSAANGVLAQTVAPSTPPALAQRFDTALSACERNHWPEACAALPVLADGGHPEAARTALLMRKYGPALYGREFLASADLEALATRRAVVLPDFSPDAEQAMLLGGV